MARKLIVLALCLVAIIGLASAADTVPATDAGAAAHAPAAGDDTIGNTDDSTAAGGAGPEDVVAAPVGTEAAHGPDAAHAPGPASAATALHVSAGAAAAATVASFFF